MAFYSTKKTISFHINCYLYEHNIWKLNSKDCQTSHGMNCLSIERVILLPKNDWFTLFYLPIDFHHLNEAIEKMTLLNPIDHNENETFIDFLQEHIWFRENSSIFSQIVGTIFCSYVLRNFCVSFSGSNASNLTIL